MNNSIQVSCSKKNLKTIRDFVTQYLSQYDLSEIVLNQIVLAVDEISANLIIHANQENADKFMELAIERKNGQLLFEISDNGISFQRSNYKEPDIEEHIRIGKKGGVGIAIVNRIMDKVEFTSEEGRNICRLYKTVF
ncbi:ATP-binding protein [Adhaeribacter sp. BT258]|uniref:ATP-binding protein n=1 Tax=Adhaeribacter terrigena TaxID=2793070 RepID=A0ABS1BYX7_9BACT|nr:ATP-binding protein [Adhaeribacter terrigena]MBK0401480.1 ATP-binding protein [Adhaeribacter terrigena]